MRASLVVLSLVVGACAGDPTAEQSLALAGARQLVRAGSGKCLDVTAAGTANGTKLQQWACNGTAAQSFVLDDRGGGVVRLVSSGAQKCVDVKGNGGANGTQVQLWSCHGGGAQRFRIEDAGDGTSRVVHVKSGKCLDVNAASGADGAKVQIWSCNGTDAQRWRLEPAGEPPDDDDDDDGLEWRTANLTTFTSYPEPGSEECEEFNGCTWAGHFAFVDGQMPESWVMSHDIAAVHAKDAGQYALKTLRVRQDGRQIDVTVYDMCSDSDCDGCCTANSAQTGFLIDLEKYTMERFGSYHGIVEWACLDCD